MGEVSCWFCVATRLQNSNLAQNLRTMGLSVETEYYLQVIMLVKQFISMQGMLRDGLYLASEICNVCLFLIMCIDFWCVIYCSQGEGSTSQTWTKSSVDKERSTLPRRRTGFNAGSLIPGSVSTMVSLPESDEDQNVTTLASPSFQSMLDSDASSEYETDLEEDFPGKMKLFTFCHLLLLHSLANNRTDLAGEMFLVGEQLPSP